MRKYDLDDIRLIRNSPHRFTLSQWRLISDCEYYLIYKCGNPNAHIHVLMRSAIGGYKRECPGNNPWDENYERKPPPPLPPPVTPLRAASNLRELVLAFLAEHGRSKTSSMRELLERRGYNAGSIHTVVSLLAKERLIVRKSAGIYDLLPKGDRAVEATMPKSEPEPLPGAVAVNGYDPQHPYVAGVDTAAEAAVEAAA